MMDISGTLQPNSEQLDAIELIAGPRIFEVASVSAGNAEQPVNIHFENFPRPWRPSKGMRRVLAFCWGTDASQWTGRRVTLYFDPDVTFGKEKPGGTRISALSHIDSVKKVPLLVARGRSAVFTVKPLENAPAPQQQPDVTEAHVEASSNEAQLREWWNAYPNLRPVIEARVAVLKGAAVQQGDAPTEAGA